jgi:hypothetical protein
MGKLRIVLFWLAGLVLASAAPLILPRNWGYKPPTGIGINWESPLSQGLVGAYLLNSGTGGRAYDSTGFNAPAALNNSPAQAPADARLGKGLNLVAGSSQSVDFGSGPRLVIGAGGFTFAVGYQSAGTNGFALSSRAASGAGYEILVGASGVAGQTALRLSDGNVQAATGNATISTTTGEVLVGVVDRSTNFSYLYDRGVLQQSASISGIGSIANTQDPFLGKRGATYITMNAYLAYFWNRALRPAEVLELYIHPYSMFQSPSPLPLLLSPNGNKTIHWVTQQ